jgi:hypothetical protein
MSTVQATRYELFDLAQDLRVQRAKADDITRGPYVAGMRQLWKQRTADLIRQALGEDHYDFKTFSSATASFRMPPPMASEMVIGRIRLENDRRFIEPHLPPLDDAIAEIEKTLSRLGAGALPESPVASPTSALPGVEFSFVKDPKLRTITERDYGELRVAVHYQSEKSKAMLAGSVIEAVVLDLLLQKSIPFADLKGMAAFDLYERAKAEGLLGGRHASAAHATRDGRNFVHPGVEYREGALTREQADLVVSLMRAILGEMGVL